MPWVIPLRFIRDSSTQLLSLLLISSFSFINVSSLDLDISSWAVSSSIASILEISSDFKLEISSID